MIHSRAEHTQFLEEELRAQTEAYKQKLDTSAQFLLKDREELFVAQFLKFQDGEMILKFSNKRGLPRQGEYLYCFTVAKELRDYRNWKNKTYGDLIKAKTNYSEIVCIWQRPSNEKDFSIAGFRGVEIEFSVHIQEAEGMIVLLGPNKPPFEYIANLQNIVQNKNNESVNIILDQDFQISDWKATLLDNKSNIPDFVLVQLTLQDSLIIQGPPGTGKTWLAKRLAYALIGKKDKERVRAVQFHPNLSYEDFVRGWRPSGDGKLSLVDGAFMEAIEDAKQSSHPHVIVIEEINRGNPAQIFGEMLTLLEGDKRDPSNALELSYRRYQNERVFIPRNLFVIGTMNVADRSLAIVDMALRRRFAFYEMEPLFNSAWQTWLENEIGFKSSFINKISTRISSLNDTISEDPGLGAHYRIGHSYLTPPTEAQITDGEVWFQQVVETELRPLLREYWFDDPARAESLIAGLIE